MKRLGFKKSRNGCSQCKKRRVKGEGVILPSTSTSASTFLPTFGTAQSTFLGSADPSDSPDSPDGWVSNAELLIHYTTVTYLTFSCNDSLTKFLQSDLPREGLSHPFLLRELMAFSGFHLAYLHPEQRQTYLLLASKNQDLAIRGLRETISKGMTPENCQALFMTSIFLTISKFAAFSAVAQPQNQTTGSLTPITSLLEIFNTMHSMAGVFRSTPNDIRLGTLEGLLRKESHTPSPRVPSLLARLQKLKLSIQSESQDDETKTALVSAVDSFVGVTAKITNHEPSAAAAEVRAIFTWPMFVPREFFGLLESEHPIALVILAHYGVLIHWEAEKSWCFDHWGMALARAIEDKVGGSPWAAWLHWPPTFINDKMQGDGVDNVTPPLREQQTEL